MKKLSGFFLGLALMLAAAPVYSFAQAPAVPSKGSEDAAGVMAPGYWAIWNDAEQAKMDADIDAYRKADASFKVGAVKKGTKVKIEQISSEFVFGASAFNWNQLGSYEANARYRELFGTLFNRATVPFYWKDFEPNPGYRRFEAGIADTEEFWNSVTNPYFQPHWRRPAVDPIVDWCTEHGVAVHGHPLVWCSRKWQYPRWLLSEGIPESERRALDSLEIVLFKTSSMHAPSYDKMTEEEIAKLLPTYLAQQEKQTYERIRSIMTHYGDRIGSWDVVNESSRDLPHGLLDPSLPMCKSEYGPMFADYVWRSFNEAAKYDTDAKLLNINDYEIGEKYPQMVEGLLARGAKIEVIGSQMHLFDPQQCADIAAGKSLRNAWKLLEPAEVREFFGKLGSFGIPTCLSEITITSAGEGERGEMIQAIIARNLYRLWFSLPSMMGITWWNIVDNCGAAGEPNISGLFRRDMTPKSAYYALDQLINREWRTNLELAPKGGKIAWRGFRGTYRISWTDTRGREHSETFKLN